MRQPLVAGNWKMHGSRESVGTLLGALLASDIADTVEVAVCPTYVHLAQALELCAGSAIGVGAQDCSHAEAGAYTGEVAATMLADLGCDWVILGHSERRAYHNESDSLISAKLAAAIEAGLKPVLCVGETREQREAGEAEAVVAAQLAGALDGHSKLDGLVIAYEPVWAIGTGLTATPEQAQDIHAFIRAELAGVTGVNADATRLLYGGSVKPGNAGELFAQADIDGALVGGAALVAEDFQAICNAAA
ncbi:triose-phosphate isomerase [Seongchinamella unica]|uniref:Triosephosphate isomerase n=1 Tax=Seongchinamella unica TaxID=2547392 RepID=A0A4R5LQ46_9GAMM|nr:triose-phosphate isomerase [Seongchinamella unica]TDG12658.1 triose-phosphate isomerase [Seongchinamella unica]